MVKRVIKDMKMERPWGKMWKFFHTKKSWLKLIKVHGRTSLQSHNHRTEWHFGFYKVVPEEKHRLLPGWYIEYVRGKKADEDDIVRYSDDYGRGSPEDRVVMVSGGFDPIHTGHLNMFREAKKMGDKLLVVLNCDKWLERKKGKSFMNQDERAEIIRALEPVDHVYILESDRDDVIEAIERFRPAVFANGGDRRNENDIPEAEVCQKYNVEMVFGVGGDNGRSSSKMLDAYTALINKQ